MKVYYSRVSTQEQNEEFLGQLAEMLAKPENYYKYNAPNIFRQARIELYDFLKERKNLSIFKVILISLWHFSLVDRICLFGILLL